MENSLATPALTDARQPREYFTARRRVIENRFSVPALLKPLKKHTYSRFYFPITTEHNKFTKKSTTQRDAIEKIISNRHGPEGVRIFRPTFPINVHKYFVKNYPIRYRRDASNVIKKGLLLFYCSNYSSCFIHEYGYSNTIIYNQTWSLVESDGSCICVLQYDSRDFLLRPIPLPRIGRVFVILK